VKVGWVRLELLTEIDPEPLSFVQVHTKVSCRATAGMLEARSKVFVPQNVIVVPETTLP